MCSLDCQHLQAVQEEAILMHKQTNTPFPPFAQTNADALFPHPFCSIIRIYIPFTSSNSRQRAKTSINDEQEFFFLPCLYVDEVIGALSLLFASLAVVARRGM